MVTTETLIESAPVEECCEICGESRPTPYSGFGTYDDPPIRWCEECEKMLTARKDVESHAS